MFALFAKIAQQVTAHTWDLPLGAASNLAHGMGSVLPLAQQASSTVAGAASSAVQSPILQMQFNLLQQQRMAAA